MVGITENSKLVEDNYKKENVLLLSMSTLPPKPETHHYQMVDKDRTYNFKGCTQLENGTKYILAMLSDQSQKLDRIVIIASQETTDSNTIKDNWNILDSAVNVYEKRISDYINGVPYRIYNVEPKDVFDEDRIREDIIYTEKEIEDLFKVVTFTESNTKTYFWDVVNAIKGNNKEKKGIDLYLDTQGGSRSAIAQMDAIIQLLKDQNVTVKKRIAIKFDRGKSIQQMVEVSDQYEMHELITAMQAFKLYGSGKELDEYFKKYNENIDENLNDEKKIWVNKLMDSIQKISDAIHLCNITGFDQELVEIKQLSDSYEKKFKPSEKTEEDNKSPIDIIFEDIRGDYSELLNDEKNNTIEKIRWCCKKNFIQQALTIIESQMPAVILKSRNYISVNWTKQVRYVTSSAGSHGGNTGKCKLEEAVNNCKKEWESKENKLIQSWAYSNVIKTDKKHKNIYLNLNDENLEEMLQKWWESSDKEELLNQSKVEFKWRNKGGDCCRCEETINVACGNRRNKLCRFIQLHMALKEQRNLACHAGDDEERATLQNLKIAIEKYVYWATKLEMK